MKQLLLRHAVLRRFATIPVMLVLLAIMLAATPIAVVVDGLLALWPSQGARGRAARITLFTVFYLLMEVAGLLVAAWLWLRGGLGTSIESPRSRRAHYRLLATLLRGLFAVGSALFAFQLDPPTALAGDAQVPRLPPTPGRPLLVLSRHAGPGDSFLLVHALLTLAGRSPRIVLKEELRFDPLIDVVLGRLPHCFVGQAPDGDGTAAERIRQTAATMGPTDALLIFPEGGNFTPRRRLRVIVALRRKGLVLASARARRLRNVLPPRPAGVFAAIDAAPHADLVFVAHTGLDHIQTVRQAWRGIPLTHPVEVTWQIIPVEQVPCDPDERLRWLEGNWVDIDAWISRRQPEQPTG